MPSFDVVSEVDLHQLTNAVDQAARIVANRFDFKGVNASFERDVRSVAMTAEAEFQVTPMEDMLRSALITRRGNAHMSPLSSESALRMIKLVTHRPSTRQSFNSSRQTTPKHWAFRGQTLSLT